MVSTSPNRCSQVLVCGECAVSNRPVDPANILVDGTPGANVHVAHFRVAHLISWKADGFSARN